MADTELTPEEEELFLHNFHTYKHFIKDGTYCTLEGTSPLGHTGFLYERG